MIPSLQPAPINAPKTGLHNICSLPDVEAKVSGKTHPTADAQPIISGDNRRSEGVNSLLALDLFRFQNICKKVLTLLPGSSLLNKLLGLVMPEPVRPAHRLVECVRAYLDFRLTSRQSTLRVGYREYRFDPEVVALNNALNFLNQAQISDRACSCVYCAGAPFYAPKKPVASVALVQAKRMSS